jgi:hypothetical protein
LPVKIIKPPIINNASEKNEKIYKTDRKILFAHYKKHPFLIYVFNLRLTANENKKFANFKKIPEIFKNILYNTIIDIFCIKQKIHCFIIKKLTKRRKKYAAYSN